MFDTYTIEQYNKGVKYLVIVDSKLDIVDDCDLSNMRSDPFISSFLYIGIIVWNDSRYVQCNNIESYRTLIEHLQKNKWIKSI